MSEHPLVSVVDDDESIRDSLPELLRQLGYGARAYSSAEAFLASGALGDTTCVILDIAMPGMSGPDLQDELFRRQLDVPIIFITAHSAAASVSRLLERGAIDCLIKPFSEAALLRALHTALGRRQAMSTTIRGMASEPYTGRSAALFEVVPMSDLNHVVFVVDDDISIRESLELLLRSAGLRAEVYASAHEFLQRARPTVPHCLVLDVSLPGLSGLELQQQLLERPEMPIVFITGYGDVPMAVRAMRAGAVDVLTKPFDDSALLDAVRGALVRSRDVQGRQAETDSLRRHYESLTARERGVMGLVVMGLLNKQVGVELGISEITVKAHRGQVMRKMQAYSLADLVTMAARLGLPTPGSDPDPLSPLMHGRRTGG